MSIWIRWANELLSTRHTNALNGSNLVIIRKSCRDCAWERMGHKDYEGCSCSCDTFSRIQRKRESDLVKQRIALLPLLNQLSQHVKVSVYDISTLQTRKFPDFSLVLRLSLFSSYFWLFRPVSCERTAYCKHRRNNRSNGWRTHPLACDMLSFDFSFPVLWFFIESFVSSCRVHFIEQLTRACSVTV